MISDRNPSGSKPRSYHVIAIASFIVVAAINWLFAARMPGVVFAYSSLLIFLWLMVLIATLHPRAAILLLPVAITRFATMISFLAIEGGAYIPEINRVGIACDASASFVVFTAIYFLAFVAIFATIEPPFTAYARSRLIDGSVRLLVWPVVALCAGWCLIALAHGATTGFPLIKGIDRFTYRHYHSSTAVLLLLENKFLFAVMLGCIAFSAQQQLVRIAAALTFCAMTATYFLFGDKFFTILTEIAFFVSPYMLANHRRLLPMVVRLAPIALVLTTCAGAASLYIYSDYGRLPTERALKTMGERVSEQGEVWFVATRDFRRVSHWDAALTARYLYTLKDTPTPTAAMHQGVETYFFIQRYAPARLASAFKRSAGWVQWTMGTEAMALVMFGYVGVALTMVVAAVLTALVACYLERALLSGFPPSLFFAVWAYLQVYVAVQQASLSTVASPGQIKRFLLFFVIELLLFAINRVQPERARRRRFTAAAA